MKLPVESTDWYDQLVRDHQEEIEEYRRRESQRVGGDIGWDWAVEEWMAKNLPDWQELQWDQMVAHTVRGHYLRLATN